METTSHSKVLQNTRRKTLISKLLRERKGERSAGLLDPILAIAKTWESQKVKESHLKNNVEPLSFKKEVIFARIAEKQKTLHADICDESDSSCLKIEVSNETASEKQNTIEKNICNKSDSQFNKSGVVNPFLKIVTRSTICTSDKQNKMHANIYEDNDSSLTIADVKTSCLKTEVLNEEKQKKQKDTFKDFCDGVDFLVNVCEVGTSCFSEKDKLSNTPFAKGTNADVWDENDFQMCDIETSVLKLEELVITASDKQTVKDMDTAICNSEIPCLKTEMLSGNTTKQNVSAITSESEISYLKTQALSETTLKEKNDESVALLDKSDFLVNVPAKVSSDARSDKQIETNLDFCENSDFEFDIYDAENSCLKIELLGKRSSDEINFEHKQNELTTESDNLENYSSDINQNCIKIFEEQKAVADELENREKDIQIRSQKDNSVSNGTKQILEDFQNRRRLRLRLSNCNASKAF